MRERRSKYHVRAADITITEVASPGEGVAVSSPRSLRPLLSIYEGSLQQGPETRRVYVKVARVFLTWAERHSRRIDEPNVLTDYLRYLKEGRPAHSPKTVNLYLAALRSFYTWLERSGLQVNLSAGVKGVSCQDGFTKESLTEQQASDLLRYFETYHSIRRPEGDEGGRSYLIRSREEIALRNYAMVSTMLRCGLRTIEVVRLRMCDLKKVSGLRVISVWGKGRGCADRNIRLTDTAYAPVASYLAVRGATLPADPLFAGVGPGRDGRPLAPRTVQQICKTGLRAIGIDSDEITTHSLRHTAAEMMIEKGASLLDVQTALRHSNPATTEIYIHRVMERRQMENPVQALLDDCFNSPKKN